MGLGEQLEALPKAVKQRIDARGFDAVRLLRWAEEMGRGQDARNLLRGVLEPVRSDGLAELPEPGSGEHQRLAAIGGAAIGRGELAVCVLAGGMATRMGGVVKATVELAPGFTFLDVPLSEREVVRRRHGRAPALWLMTSEPTHQPIQQALAARGVDSPEVAPFEQFVSLRLCEDGNLFLDEHGEPSVYATGHGDLPDALGRSGLLAAFVARGGRYVWISNLDNVGGRIDEALLGQHIESGAPLTVELVDKRPGDKGGGPVIHDGKPIIAEHFRLPRDFDADAVPVFNTNTFLVDAHALAELDMDWTYVEVRKDVGARKAVQFERLLGEMTVAIRPRFLRVPRQGEHNRFIGLKSREDLEAEAAAIDRLVRALRQGSASG